MVEGKFERIRKYLWECLQGSGYEDCTYLVGGCVRDHLLGKEPKDIDLVVEKPGGGIGLAEWLWENGFLTHPPVVYQGFGTTQFTLSGETIEAVQTRSEEYICRGSRNPMTGYGDLEVDWKRRDFTINTLYKPLSPGAQILDPSGHGVDDLRERIIRTTSDPEIIFQDDPLRILRAIRFSVCLGYDILSPVMEGMKASVQRLSIISKERVVSEVGRILMSPSPAKGLRLLGDIGALWILSEDLEKTVQETQNKYHLGTVWEHTLEVIDKLKGQDEVTLLAGLFHDIGKIRCKTVGEDGRIHFIGHSEVGAGMVRNEIFPALHFPRKVTEEVAALIYHHMDLKETPKPKPKKLRRLQYILGSKTQWERYLNLLEADNMSHAPGYCIFGQTDWIREAVGDEMFNYHLPVSGVDIMKVREIGPGELVSRYLDHLLKLAFSNPGMTREDMLRHLKNLSPQKLKKKKEH